VKLPLMATLLLSACATPQPVMHPKAELAAVAHWCEAPKGSLGQQRLRPQFLFYLVPNPPKASLTCVAHWAHQNHLRLVHVEAVESEPEAQP